jgi:hypothetical protein
LKKRESTGSWIYRSFNPTYIAGAPEREDRLILADADLNLEHRTSPTTLDGTIEWPSLQPEQKEGLVLKGTVLEGDIRGVEIVGTGRPGTGTDGWEYRYHGHLLPSGRGLVATVVDRPILGGSVFRAKTHNGDQPSLAGEVFAFFAVWKQPVPPPRGEPFLRSEFAGSWTYRSFRNNISVVHKTAPQNTDELILQEADFKLETSTDWWKLQGAIVWPDRSLDLTGVVRPGGGGQPVSFEIAGTGRAGTATADWQYYYRGYLTQTWRDGGGQSPALVGSVMRAKPHGEAATAVVPFIALKR